MKTRHIQHLYYRAGFGIDHATLLELSSKSKQEVVSQLFEASQKNVPLELDLSEFASIMESEYQKPNTEEEKMVYQNLQKKSRQKIQELNSAWIDRMVSSDEVLREKMTLFWANVFVCRDTNIWYVQHYNNTLRKNALGNFRDFVKAISREAAMSKYLNNKQNVKESPNENFARELMELFTLGVGNYMEKDIKESARAFTGWSYKRNGDFFLRRLKHDDGLKTFMGNTGNFDGDDIIDIICEQKQCARFICEKIYRYFVNPKVNERHVEELTERFYKDYDIKQMMAYIFTSDWFYSDGNVGVKIKSPMELLVGIQKIIPLRFERPKQLLYVQRIMGQVLLYPPNVSGWKQDRNWIDSNTLMFRMKLAAVLLNNEVINVDVKGEFEDDFEDYYTKEANKKRFLKISKDWSSFDSRYGRLEPHALKELLVISPIDKDTEQLLSHLDIKNNKEYCIQLMSIPEYQLC